jgi:hypothetical protein
LTWPQLIFDTAILFQQEEGSCHEGIIPQSEDDQEKENGLLQPQGQYLPPKDYFNVLTRDNVSNSLVVTMTSKILEFDPQVKVYIDRFNKYSSLFKSDIETRITAIEEKHKIGSILFRCECTRKLPSK